MLEGEAVRAELPPVFDTDEEVKEEDDYSRVDHELNDMPWIEDKKAGGADRDEFCITFENLLEINEDDGVMVESCTHNKDFSFNFPCCSYGSSSKVPLRTCIASVHYLRVVTVY